jgi:predicted transcriptional regulator
MAHSRSDPLTRTNVTLPADLLARVDELAGPRGRSRYVADAVAQRVRRDELGRAIAETGGAMVGKPGWMSPEEVVRWVDDLRSEETD